MNNQSQPLTQPLTQLPTQSLTSLTTIPKQKKHDPKFSPVWSHFTPYVKKAGNHYSATCNYYKCKIQTASVSNLEEHLTNIYTKILEGVKLKYFKKRVSFSEGESVSIVTLSKKWKLIDEKQVKLNLFYESIYLTPRYKKSIECTIV